MSEKFEVMCEKLASSPEQIQATIAVIASTGAQIQVERDYQTLSDPRQINYERETNER